MRYIGVDIESIGLNPVDGVIWMLSITEGKKSNLYHNCNGVTRKDIPKNVLKDLEDPKVCKIIHSSIFDVPYLRMNLGIPAIPNIWDTELCEIVIQGISLNIKRKNVEPGSATEAMLINHGTALEYVLPRYGFPRPKKSIRNNFVDRPKGKPFTKEEIKYAVDDTKYLPQLQKAQEFLLKRDGLLEVALLENKVAEKYHDMKVYGIGWSPQIWESIATEQKKEYETRLAKLPKQVNNWNSEKQVKAYFRSKGIAIESYNELDEVYLKTRNKTLGDFINTRELSKSVSSYGFNWFEDGYMDRDGRIRPHIRQIIKTGRNAMSDPNLQQLPGSGNSDPLRLRVLQLITGDKKKKMQHRRAFIPRPGHVFVIGDFSGQEIGIMAAAAQEELWINALLRKEDVHGLTASLINKAAWDAGKLKDCRFPKKCKCPAHLEEREPAKITNFMQAYGGGAEKLSKFFGIPIVTATAYMAAHKRVTPNLTNYLKKSGREAVATGVAYSADPYRRRMVMRGDEEWQFANQGKNNPIQGAGANMLKLALASLPSNLPCVLVIHDEIILEVPYTKWRESMKALKSIMEKSADYITGIKGLVTVEPKVQMNIMKDLPTCKLIKQIQGGEYCYVG